jgi:hypothetical protein
MPDPQAVIVITIRATPPTADHDIEVALTDPDAELEDRLAAAMRPLAHLAALNACSILRGALLPSPVPPDAP